MKFLKIASKAIVCLFLGTVVTAYALPQEQEKKAEPAKQEKAAPARPAQQRAQQPKSQAKPQPQQKAQQPKPQAQPQQRAQQPKPQAKPQPQQRAQQPKAQVKPQPQQRAQQPKPQAKPQQRAQAAKPAQQAKSGGGQPAASYAPPRRSTQQAQSWQRGSAWKSHGAWQGGATFQAGRASNWAGEHRTWAQRGGYGGYYIPQASFGLYFGVGHWFRIGSEPFIVGGYPEFRYGGYTFMLVDPWPGDWDQNWYDADELYIGYNNGYYLYNQMHPGEAVAISVVM